jgi:hypothetical protein
MQVVHFEEESQVIQFVSLVEQRGQALVSKKELDIQVRQVVASLQDAQFWIVQRGVGNLQVRVSTSQIKPVWHVVHVFGELQVLHPVTRH